MLGGSPYVVGVGCASLWVSASIFIIFFVYPTNPIIAACPLLHRFGVPVKGTCVQTALYMRQCQYDYPLYAHCDFQQPCPRKLDHLFPSEHIVDGKHYRGAVERASDGKCPPIKYNGATYNNGRCVTDRPQLAVRICRISVQRGSGQVGPLHHADDWFLRPKECVARCP